MATATSPKTTATAGLARRPLPELRRDRTPAALALLGDPFAGLVRARDERFARAVRARSALSSAEREIDAAVERDREACRKAALDDKPDPGRREELKATAELEAAYSAALAATDLANAAAGDLLGSIEDAGGDAAVQEVERRVSAARERLGEHLDAVEGDLSEIQRLVQLAEAVEGARKNGNGRRAWAARRRDPLIHARPASAALLAATLRDFGAPVG